MSTDEEPTFQQFLEEWMADILADDPPTLLLGQRFAKKVLVQTKELDPESMDLMVLDGSGDGGIDVAYLARADTVDEEDETERGDIWYLVQGKYGTSFSGKETIIAESNKFFDSFAMKGNRNRLSQDAKNFFVRLDNFYAKADPKKDALVWLIATDRTLNEDEMATLNEVREKGRKLLGSFFDADTISVESVYNRQKDEHSASKELVVSLSGNLVGTSGKVEGDLLVGSVPLLNIYEFLKAFRWKTGDLDMLYEKNVRKFLGTRRKVNKAIKNTLEKTPNLFGLYNNGITIVASDISIHDSMSLLLTNPYIVNGCQTTKILWEVFQQTLESGGSVETEEYNKWLDKVKKGVVLTKVVKVGSAGETALSDITRYTNSQTSVSEKDFIALDQGFQNWASVMRDRYGIFLEIQRGGWDSQRAKQKNNPNVKPYYNKFANAFDLIKVYSAGWLREAGTAYGKNGPFAPSGYIFRRLTEPGNEKNDQVSVEDLFAAFRLKNEADKIGFGRGAQYSRRQTRYLFYLVLIQLLKSVLVFKGVSSTKKDVTEAFLKVVDEPEALKGLVETALNLIDEYVSESEGDNIFKEPGYKNVGNDLHAFLRSGQIGKTKEESPILLSLLAEYERYMGRSGAEQRSIRETLWDCIQSR
ncbi:MAG: AIPR family protein [Thermoplasmatales archaeon]